MNNTENMHVVNEIQRRRRLAALALELILKRKNGKNRRCRKIWVREWLKRRDEGGGVLNMMQDNLRLHDSKFYENFYRLDEDLFEELLARITPRIQKTDTVMRQAISARQRLGATLRFLASGNSYQDLSYSLCIAPNTLSVIIPDTLRAIISELQDECIKCPKSEDDWIEIESGFKNLWQFPHCIGALDGKHINFRPSRQSGSFYRNYKNRDSIILLALVDARYKFLYVDIGRNGRMNDSAVFRESQLAQHLNNTLNTLNLPKNIPLSINAVPMPYVIVADDAFPLTENIMKPYPERGLTKSQRIFNYRLSRARRVVENAFGILANRFRILLNTIGLSVDKVELIALTCCILHNFVLSRKLHFNNIIEDNYEGDRRNVINNITDDNIICGAKGVRDYFMSYFNSIGSVPWQNNAIERGNY